MPTPAGVNATRFGFETTRENLPAAMRLFSEVLRQPTYPENEFDQAKQASLASYEQALRDPQAMGSSVLRQHIAPYAKGDVRRTRLPEEELEEIKATTLADVKKFYGDFYGASNSELTSSGTSTRRRSRLLRRPVWRLEEPCEVCARAVRLQAGRASEADDRDSGQSECVFHR